MKTIVIKCTEDDLESEINGFILEQNVTKIICISQVATSLETESMFAGILTTIIYE